MGTTINPSEPGPNCALCWGSGKAFGPGQTPLRILLRLRGMVKSPWFDLYPESRGNGNFVLEQIDTCYWLNWFGNTQIFVFFVSGLTVVHSRVSIPGGYKSCFLSEEAECSRVGYGYQYPDIYPPWLGGYYGIDWGKDL